MYSSECPGAYDFCTGTVCCIPLGDCYECNCDEQCDAEQPYCGGYGGVHVCSECRTDADCPEDRPKCHKRLGDTYRLACH